MTVNGQMDIGRKLLIMVVDDMPQNVQVVAGILRNEGFDCIPAISGDQALAVVHKRLPDLILLDIQMPDIDGFEVCRRLQESEETRDIPVIFLTARSSTEDIVKGLKLGAVDYITKPFQQGELLLRVRNHLELKLARERLQHYNEELEAKVRERTVALRVAMENEREFKDLHSKFIASVSHQFRTPMTSIMLNADLFLRSMQKGSPFPAEKVSEMFSDTVLAVKRMMSMLESNSKFLNIETLILTDSLIEANLCSFSRSAVQTFCAAEASNRTIRVLCTGEDPTKACIQPFVLETALHELLKNAVQYSAEGTDITVEVARTDGSIQIRVSNEGRGVPEYEQDLIFELFRRGHQEEEIGKVPGLGIGLAIARVCVQQAMKGRVWCTSSPGESTTFVLEIPLSVPENVVVAG